MGSGSYPVENIFVSSIWRQRLDQLGIDAAGFVLKKKGPVCFALTRHDYLFDFEKWPDTAAEMLLEADIVIGKKLLPELMPTDILKKSIVWQCSVAPYINLKNPKPFHKRAMSDIARCTRNFTKEYGQPALDLAGEQERVEWFNGWTAFDIANRASKGQKSIFLAPDIKDVFSKWITQGPLPEWMNLFRLKAGDHTLCYALAYVWDGVFYFLLPAINSNERFHSFGIGKIFVQKLIDWSVQQNLGIFDFLQGGEAYKFDWNPEVRPLYQYEIPLTRLGRLALMARRIQLRLRSKKIIK
ncbi:MAG: hypothetical protein A2583_14410 [Bdellovibrionales bacterium RIFOXYD1_FULL_53_11]|nr:MAG: hypothetical protein A2583_14410 [Bdellovibrionales bacterium RIFOXYD1_FULL_53_11]